MKRLRSWIKGFGLFWYRFVVGDDWLLAAAVVVGLAVTALLKPSGVPVWWLQPLLVIAMVGVSLRRAGRA